MAVSEGVHVIIDIPATVLAEEEDHRREKPKRRSVPAASNEAVSAAIQRHPLAEISHSPGHLLLLKLLQREERLSGRRIAAAETAMCAIRRQIFLLCSFFILFHGLFLTILFPASLQGESRRRGSRWVPPVLSAGTSALMVWLVQAELCGYWREWRRLQGEKGEGRALARRVLELRMKGASFDLCKEQTPPPSPHMAQQGVRRLKSSSVEVKWRPLTWCSRNLPSIFLVCFSILACPASHLMLSSSW